MSSDPALIPSTTRDVSWVSAFCTGSRCCSTTGGNGTEPNCCHVNGIEHCDALLGRNTHVDRIKLECSPRCQRSSYSLASKHDHTATDSFGVNEPDWRRQPDRHWGCRRHDWTAAFTVGFVVQGLFRHDEYDPIAETVSALEAGPNGWIPQLNFFVFGILVMLFGRPGRLRRDVVDCVRGRAGGQSAWMAGLFPLRENADGQTYDPTELHQPNGAVFFLSTWVGLAILSWCLRSDRRWRDLVPYTMITSAALAVLFGVLAALAIPDSGPLHPWAGLLQRLVLAVWFPSLVVLAARLRKVARAAK